MPMSVVTNRRSVSGRRPVAVTRRRQSGCAHRVQLVFPDEGSTSALVHDADLGAGVRVRIDLLDPRRWLAIRVD